MLSRTILYLGTVSVLAMMAQPALAQTTKPASDQGGAKVEEIVVTGSRIQASGFNRPTPVTVVSAEQLQASSPVGIAQGLALLPQFQGSVTTNNIRTVRTIGSEPHGNFLNLRNMGPTRTLILLDGARVPATAATGETDVSIIPELLVQRVDVVTAGVSAVYGSDAVAGVVNYILDKNFTGVRGLVQAGQSVYGDGENYRAGVAFGTGFQDDRGHVLLSVDTNWNGEVRRNERKWYDQSYAAGVLYKTNAVKPDGSIAGAPGTASNPLVFAPGTTGFSTGPGGKIFGGPPGLLNGTFINNGTQEMPFDQGGFFGASAQFGGSGTNFLWDRTLFPALWANHAFTRLSYDVTPDLNVYAEGAAAKNLVYYHAANAGLNLAIYSGNPYLPASVQAIIDAQGPGTAAAQCGNGGPAPAFCFNKRILDIEPLPEQKERLTNYSFKAGVNGKLSADWSFDANYVYGRNKQHVEQQGDVVLQKEFAAVDAVRDPATGNIVCRVTLTNPGLYPGCVPYNPFASSVSPAVASYIEGTTFYDVTTTTNDLSANITGHPFSTWAGPVGVAFGAEYRDGRLVRTSNSDPAIPVDTTGLRGLAANSTKFSVVNTGPANGSNNVKEANVELELPLAKDMPLLHSLVATGAYRYTDYSTSGVARTWKVGGTWEPVEGLRFRATESRDIRAPTLFDLFAGGTTARQNLNDIHCNCERPIGTIVTGGGNPNLKPERAKTFTVGAVFEPTFLPGFRASLDYYDLNLKNVITTLSIQQINQNCEVSNGTDPICANIVRQTPFSDHSINSAALSIFSGSINAAARRTKGYDMEADYRMSAETLYSKFTGDLNFRLLANYTQSYAIQNFVGAPIMEQAGTTDGQVPKWRASINGTYTNGPLSIFLQGRYVGALKTGPTFVYVVKELPAVWYTDVTLTYSVPTRGGNVDLFFTVNNLFNAQPPLFPANQSPNIDYPSLVNVYDAMGRYYTSGVRFRF